MICARCGGEVPDGSHFCNHCGVSTDVRVYVNPPDTIEPPARKSNPATVAILAATLLGLAAIAVYQVLNSREAHVDVAVATASPSTEPASGSPGGPPAGREPSSGSAVTPAEFSVGPAGLRYFKISIDEHMQNASVIGKFAASGGAYNDIEVFVIGRDPSINPRDGLYARAWYKTRRVTSDDLDVPLSSGEYYLVFSNAFSPSNKTVSASITIQSN